jgi:serine phosphatase RsbU (regulator of sigma subunit)/pSer/pThr/pTyr-binding forkhead associated (FHA) protein
MPELMILSADGTRGRYALTKERITIGRSRESDIFLPDQWLSRHHAEIRQKGPEHFVADLGSKNGTTLNGTRILREERLRDGDIITLGEHTLTYRGGGLAAEADEPEPLGTRVFSAKELSDIKTRPIGLNAEELARQNRLLTLLNDATRKLVEHRPLGELFEEILKLLMDAVPAERGAILLVEGTPPLPTVKASRNRAGNGMVRVSRSIARRVIQECRVVLLPNVLDDVAFKEQESIVATGIRSAVCAPLWFTPAGGADEVIGLVYLDSLKGSHTFGEEDARIVTALANVAAAKIENARLLEESLEKRRLEQDLQAAARIQRSLLPTSKPTLPGWDLAGSNQPCRTIGGDYYDFALESGYLLFALGDVAGKGMGAALLMTVMRAAVRDHWTDARLAEAVARINKTICLNSPDGKYVTFFLARLDPASGRLGYVNAGHNPPLVVRGDGSVEALEAGGMVVGLMEGVPYAEGSAEVRPGDVVLVFSDGVTETWSPENEEFGERGLIEAVRRGRGLSAESLQNLILQELDRFAAGAKATDDRTLIVLKRS